MTLVIGTVASNGVLLVADRMVSRDSQVLGTAEKLVDLPDGSTVGVAGSKWSCKQVMESLRERPVEGETRGHVLGVLKDVRERPHPSYGGASGEIVPSVKAILLSCEDGSPKLYWSRRTEQFQPIHGTYVIGDIDSDASPPLAGVLDPDLDCLEALWLCWVVIRAFEEMAPGSGIGLCGEMPDVRLARADQVRRPSEAEIEGMSQSVEEAVSALGTD